MAWEIGNTDPLPNIAHIFLLERMTHQLGLRRVTAAGYHLSRGHKSTPVIEQEYFQNETILHLP
eukprot:12469539-Ditylum_brightwellii.AAC.1